jgi:hypothetical protein
MRWYIGITETIFCDLILKFNNITETLTITLKYVKNPHCDVLNTNVISKRNLLRKD